MPIALDLVVQNPRAQRAAYTHIKVYRGPQAGPFAEITGPTTRVPLSDEIDYTYLDATGAETDWYRIAYWNERTGAESAQGAPTLGQTDPALDVISVRELKEFFLFGVDLTDDAGRPYSDALFRFYIQSAVSWLEHRLDIPLRRLVVTAERQDFYPEEFRKYQATWLKHYPVLEVTEVRATFPGQQGAARAYPADWIQLTPESGLVEIVPGLGGLLPFAGGSALLVPSLYGGSAPRSLPHILEVDYVAGFERGRVPAVLRELAGKIASLGPLNIAGDLVVGAGIQAQSLSLDGLTQSLTTTNSSTNAGYGARIIQYRKEISEQLSRIAAYYHGVKGRAV